VNSNVPSSPSVSSTSVNQNENVDDDLKSPPSTYTSLSDQNEHFLFDLNLLPPESELSDVQSNNINYLTPSTLSLANSVSPDLREPSPLLSSTTPGYQRTAYTFDLNQLPCIEDEESTSTNSKRL